MEEKSFQIGLRVSLLMEASPFIILPMALREFIRTALQVWLLAFVTVEVRADASEEGHKLELQAQGALVEALAQHFGSLSPVEGTEALFAELRVGLKQLGADTQAEKLEAEKLASIEREVRVYVQGGDAYREDYLLWVRLTAKGEKHPEVRLLDGKIYREVVIRRVTDIGLEIRHLSGSARLHHEDLGEKWQERFLWSSEESRRSLVEEARVDRNIEQLQRYAVEQGRDPVIAREEATARLRLAELESSTPIVPAKLEPSEPLELADLEPAQLEPSRKVAPSRPGAPEKSR